MKRQAQLVILIVALVATCLAQAQTKPKQYTNENRPYEFGFKIPGEQHRQESKDEDGIIMGEFGFITGDGIYHVTVFATDKDGNYKILSMKNIRVGPSPWGKKASVPPPTTTTTTTTTTTPEPDEDAFILDGKPGCSGCLIPTPPPPGSPPRKPLKVPKLKHPVRPSPNPIPAPPSPNPAFPSSPGSNPAFPRPASPNPAFPRPDSQNTGFPGKNPGSPAGLPVRGQFQEKPDPAFGTGKPNPVNPNAFQPSPNPGAAFPGGPPGSTDGLPDGMTIDDVMGLLYKFNYTVGFHGHHETGYKNGDKEGEYYTHFRDGTARKVTYTANELGFQPKISVVKIDGDEVPRAETEKEYGLKGYEFKWFNRR